MIFSCLTIGRDAPRLMSDGTVRLLPWGAHNRDSDIWYLYSEYKRGHAEPVVHAHNLKLRGDWIPFVGDPAARASSQKDGEKLIKLYRDLGLKLYLPITP